MGGGAALSSPVLFAGGMPNATMGSKASSTGETQRLGGGAPPSVPSTVCTVWFCFAVSTALSSSALLWLASEAGDCCRRVLSPRVSSSLKYGQGISLRAWSSSSASALLSGWRTSRSFRKSDQALRYAEK